MKDAGIWWRGEGHLVSCDDRNIPGSMDEVVWEMTDKYRHHWSVSYASFLPTPTLGQVQRITMQIIDWKHPDNDKIPLALSLGAKVNPKSFPCVEPTMHEKLSIMKRFKKFDSDFAIEVFPEQDLLVDEANMYHIWLLEKGADFFPFCVKEAMNRPDDYSWQSNKLYDGLISTKVVKSSLGPVCFLYLHTHKYIPWVRKQLIKDKLFGDYINAVEIISPIMAEKDYECLVLFPCKYTLPFGLKRKLG